MKRRAGKGGKTELVGAPNVDIELREAIKKLQKRTTAKAVTCLFQVKAYRGEPANEEADIQAD